VETIHELDTTNTRTRGLLLDIRGIVKDNKVRLDSGEDVMKGGGEEAEVGDDLESGMNGMRGGWFMEPDGGETEVERAKDIGIVVVADHDDLGGQKSQIFKNG
jgi:hypothetical protein